MLPLMSFSTRPRSQDFNLYLARCTHFGSFLAFITPAYPQLLLPLHMDYLVASRTLNYSLWIVCHFCPDFWQFTFVPHLALLGNVGRREGTLPRRKW